MGDYNYSTTDFTVIAIITWIALAVALIIAITNICRHSRIKYKDSKRQLIIAIYVFYMIWIGLLFMALWLYSNAEPILIAVQILLTLAIFTYYLYMKESLTMYLYNYFMKYELQQKEMIEDKKRRRFMLEREYPMQNIVWCERSQLTDYFVCYWYVLEKKAEFLFWIDVKLENFGEALKYQITNQVLIYIYVIAVPLVQIIEYILEETNSLDVGGFNLLIISRTFIIIVSLIAVVFLVSFSRSFRNILPFENFYWQVMSVVLIQAGYNIIGSIIRYTQTSIGEYNKQESYTLLFIVIISCAFAFGLLFPTFSLNPETILKNETKMQIRVAERTYTQENMDPSVNKSNINAGDTTQHEIRKPEPAKKKSAPPAIKKSINEEYSGSENIDASIVDPNKMLFVHGDIKTG